jgi:hypothetical protein
MTWEEQQPFPAACYPAFQYAFAGERKRYMVLEADEVVEQLCRDAGGV